MEGGLSSQDSILPNLNMNRKCTRMQYGGNDSERFYNTGCIVSYLHDINKIVVSGCAYRIHTVSKT